LKTTNYTHTFDVTYRKSKIALKALNKYKNDNNYIESSEKLLDYIPSKFTLKVLEKTLWHLQQEGFIEFLAAEDTIIDIYVNYKAENYNEFNRMELVSYIKKSIVTPIFIAFTTALITTFVTIHFKF